MVLSTGSPPSNRKGDFIAYQTPSTQALQVFMQASWFQQPQHCWARPPPMLLPAGPTTAMNL